MGHQEIEDALKRLDRLTREEALMAAAQILNLTHTIDNKVTGVDNKLDTVFQGRLGLLALHSPQYSDSAYAGQMGGTQRWLWMTSNVRYRPFCYSSSVPEFLKGNQLRESLRRWVSPPDPSTNQNIACDIHHGGAAEWFFQGSIFAEWRSTGSLLWIYGKRMFFPLFY